MPQGSRSSRRQEWAPPQDPPILSFQLPTPTWRRQAPLVQACAEISHGKREAGTNQSITWPLHTYFETVRKSQYKLLINLLTALSTPANPSPAQRWPHQVLHGDTCANLLKAQRHAGPTFISTGLYKTQKQTLSFSGQRTH